MDNIDIKHLIDQLNRIESKLDKLLPSDQPTEWHSIERIEHYISKSGNPTWKAFTEDGTLIYLRQAHKDLLVECGLWDVLNQMTVEDALYPDGLDIGTIPDGDFKRPVQIEGIIPTLEPEPTDEIGKLRKLVTSTNYVVLDTETSDLNGYVCQIAVIAPDGEQLLHKLVQPPARITPEAAKIHGITNEMVANAPEFYEIADELVCLLDGTNVVGWNVLFDKGALLRTIEAYMSKYPRTMGRIRDVMAATQFIDLMAPFSDEIYREWSEYHGNNKLQKLTTAANYYGISTDGAHGAAADCQMTLSVLKHMVGDELPF